ncbi:oligosaccharide flippase family protein [Spirosoma endbachense]|uniref:Oligosaccharide flippase family protein n=1 Tax=Spirosoma endbachense TaxID=2666025 RepID=A0A6P1W4X3_9BACT|nr:oligosaccharide flippase family protein [Spirosoma endbachense]QHW00502.1 oligosaccharide flippase family protein [Spirosoma endbachense]
MKTISLDYLRERIRNGHPRTRKAQFNTVLGLGVKGGGVLISLLLVPMTIDYLSKDTYGTWLTISSIVTMISFFDIGIGNGLRNKLSEAVSRREMILARAYVSTAYFIFGVLQLTFIVIFLLLFRYVPWQRILNTTIDNEQLQNVVLITAIAIAIKLVLDILSYVLFALQESGVVNLFNFLFNTLILIGTYLLTCFTKGDLIYLAIVTTFSPILVLLVSGFILYRKRLKAYKPTFRLANVKYAKSLLSLGYKFFVIQMAVIILFYTDNLIITQLFGPSEVATYNVSFRYFNAANTIFSILIAPYWSAFTEASVKNDTEWMKRTYINLKKMWLFFFALVIIMIIVAQPVCIMWVGDRVKVPILLNLIMGLNVVIICWNNITVTVTNGLGRINLQLFCSVFASLVNIPLAIYLGQGLDLGSSGVILSTCISLLPAALIGYIQSKKLINNNAHGIWAN